ncbi:MAG: glycosyltransferase [Promethearchaeota archaeon]|nr:MAG: glycosyltransferase [Candidatus Lokiarchaeota archaeon]
MNSKPKISVIIPTYNEETNIKKSLIAVKKQRCNIPYEIIVADGQSSDETVSIAKNFAKVYITPKKGKSFQVNYVVPKTSGDLLVFLDADTLIDEFFLQKVYRIFEKHKNLFACSARVKYYDGKAISFKLGSQVFSITNYFFLNFSMHLYYFFKTLLRYPELIGCNIIIRRGIFLKVGGFKQLPPNLIGMDKVFSDSLIYLSRKMKKGKIRTLNFISVLTSGRFLNRRRSLGRITQYHSKKNIFYNLAKDTDLKIE